MAALATMNERRAERPLRPYYADCGGDGWLEAVMEQVRRVAMAPEPPSVPRSNPQQLQLSA